jgi:hypothetical protein
MRRRYYLYVLAILPRFPHITSDLRGPDATDPRTFNYHVIDLTLVLLDRLP